MNKEEYISAKEVFELYNLRWVNDDNLLSKLKNDKDEPNENHEEKHLEKIE